MCSHVAALVFKIEAAWRLVLISRLTHHFHVSGTKLFHVSYGQLTDNIPASYMDVATSVIIVR